MKNAFGEARASDGSHFSGTGASRGTQSDNGARVYFRMGKGGKDLYPGLKFDLGEEQSGGKEMNVNRALLSDAVLAKSPFFPFCHLFFFVFLVKWFINQKPALCSDCPPPPLSPHCPLHTHTAIATPATFHEN